MKKLLAWFKKKRLKPVPVLLLALALLLGLILLAILGFYHLKNDDRLSLKEDAEIRSGPGAQYPELYQIKKGEAYEIIGKKGKWVEVKSGDDKRKGWIAGWHTDLGIKEDVNPNEHPLKGKTIVLDPGHGGGDQGAASSTKAHSLEKTITLKTAQELKKLLEKEGAKVELTREEDKFVSLEERKVDGDAYLSIHNDALKSPKANGATVYWYHEQQEILAETLNQSIQKKAVLSNRGARQQNFQVLRQTETPAVLLELGYISNPTDEEMINDKLHRHVVEHAVVDGLKYYFME
ncbi:N-acetylmuramoyl-L-alanine amidase [Staphylococcus massiliensis]|uniref:N-acetylmuramoyl-L-alanine amidase n=1 Tax=Staphylococcus massiliensis TaxID=555791 RepID=UPI001EE0C5C9|nr:N-acetylmuramoyl-L-alanine amidase [Staphylococcus massiliensis]MCG3399073.1 N-acetylmuramoyl-L-alanine amidase [Staphylococcus massiliensis]MCG3400929.1 N-acetylmuramoyl-L-alanine amidase [Staphylococcus massiliensis]MCG3412466.1 N-acetylmuramoyl-L-alanine amidase [Staphylococcus massiliensis]